MMTFGWDGEVNTQDIQKKKSGFVRDKEDSTLNKEVQKQKAYAKQGISRHDIKVDPRYGAVTCYLPGDNKIQ